MATFVNPLERVVSSDTLTPAQCQVGDVLVDSIGQTLVVIAQNPTTGAPVAVPVPLGGGGGGWSFVFGPSLVEDPSKNEFSSWPNLVAALNALPVNAGPVVTFVESATIPPGVWNLNNAQLRSSSLATGVITATVANGAVLDNLQAVWFGLLLSFQHAGPGPAITFSQTPFGAPWVLAVGVGGSLHNAGSAPLILTPGTNQTVVLSVLLAPNISGPLGAPFVQGGGGGDVVIGSQIFGVGPFASLPDGWAAGSGSLDYQNGLSAVVPLTPGWTGAVTVGFQVVTMGDRALYTPANVGDWSGVAPANVAAALDRIAAAIGPIP